MLFETDRQTINDLELFPKSKGSKSILSLFADTKSIGGKDLLEKIFSNPLTDRTLIEQRIEALRFFQENQINIDIDKNSLDIIEHYLSRAYHPTSFLKSIANLFTPDNEYYLQRRGIKYLIRILNELYSYATSTTVRSESVIERNYRNTIITTIDNSSLKAVKVPGKREKLFLSEYSKFNLIFKRYEINGVRRLLDLLYEIDVYKAVAGSCSKYGLTLPSFGDDENSIKADGLFHPFVKDPVRNDFEFAQSKRVCFITGPNMAGKSTFLKALSICVYLSHLGFPVPAAKFRISLFNGLLTTINLSDNLSSGYSHYYNEVLRIKFVAEQINKAGNIFIVFDELFRGTNLKDAYEASLNVISAFSGLNRSLFAISTHIIEVADQLKNNKAVFFNYFEANLIDGIPRYNYTLKEGITNERIGMYILNKEKVLETINKSSESPDQAN